MHPVAVCALMLLLARQHGFDAKRTSEAGFAGLLHDIGKAFVPETILNKPGPLNAQEMALVRTHPERGHALLLECGLDNATALDVCLHHHEKTDGSGYPNRLAGDGISQVGRMGAICDAYHAATSDRPYKAASEPATALADMVSWQGHFDRAILAAFIRVTGVFPVGSLVRLASERLAVVMESRPDSVRAPLVKVFHSTRSNEAVTPQLLDLSASAAGDRILCAEARQSWPFQHLDELCTT